MFKKIIELQNTNEKFIVTTVTDVSGSSPREIGAKMIVLENGEFFGSIGGGNLEKIVLEACKASFASNDEKAAWKEKISLGAVTGQCCGGVVEVFFEKHGNGPELYIFGAGHVAQALAKTMEDTPFRVHLIDERKEWIYHEDRSKTAILHEMKWDEFVSDAYWNKNKIFVVVMTHEHTLDQDIIADVILKREHRYAGLIGSESKWKRFIQRYEQRGFDLSKFDAVNCPIGDALAGKAPKEVAISIAAKLLKVWYAN